MAKENPSDKPPPDPTMFTEPPDPMFTEWEEAQRRRRFRAEMESWQARWRAGDVTAVARAMHTCSVSQEPIPEWMIDAVAKLTIAAMSEEEKRLRRDWDIHQHRWEALTELRARRFEFWERGDDRGATWERAREAVSELLKGTAAEGSADAVKRSYDLVQAAGGADATFERFKALRKPG